jgi:hypothetical protein
LSKISKENTIKKNYILSIFTWTGFVSSIIVYFRAALGRRRTVRIVSVISVVVKGTGGGSGGSGGGGKGSGGGGAG